jgi:hypothetical protein
VGQPGLATIVNKVWPLALVLGMAVIGCQVSQKADADPVEFNIDKEFSLVGGQEATIGGENLRLRFDEVLEDSRCPTQVECFWTGQARIAILVQPYGREATNTEFNTNPAPGQDVQTVQVGQYTIALLSLDPYPQTPDQSIALEEYRATLTVRKA